MLAYSLPDYELFIYALQDHYVAIQASTLTVIRQASNVATVEGDLYFRAELRLHIMEVVRFDVAPARIARYGYEIWRGGEKVCWYDSQPHPDDSSLAPTHPHHKHIQPDLKHHRVPAPQLSFAQPNLPALIEEVEQLLK